MVALGWVLAFAFFLWEEARATALANAIDSGDPGEVRAIIQEGADVNEKSENGFTPLHIAAWRDDYNADDVVKVSIEHGAEAGAISIGGSTPLASAAFSEGG